MVRFCLFPLLIVALGGICPFLWGVEALGVYMPLLSGTSRAPLGYFDVELWQSTFDSLILFSGWGMGGGALVALVAVVWDTIKNGPTDRSGKGTVLRLWPNLFWCHLYVAGITVVNRLVADLVYFSAPSSSLTAGLSPTALASSNIFSLTLAGVGLGMVWAIFRSINTSNVLTPHVLLDRLRQIVRPFEN